MDWRMQRTHHLSLPFFNLWIVKTFLSVREINLIWCDVCATFPHIEEDTKVITLKV